VTQELSFVTVKITIFLTFPIMKGLGALFSKVVLNKNEKTAQGSLFISMENSKPFCFTVDNKVVKD